MLLSDVCLTSVCLSVAYIGPKSRTERPRKTKIGTKLAHVIRDSDTTFKVKRSPGHFAHRHIGTSGSCSGGHENVLAVGNCCYVAVCSAVEGASAPTEGGEGRGHIVAAARLLLVILATLTTTDWHWHRHTAKTKRCTSGGAYDQSAVGSVFHGREMTAHAGAFIARVKPMIFNICSLTGWIAIHVNGDSSSKANRALIVP